MGVKITTIKESIHYPVNFKGRELGIIIYNGTEWVFNFNSLSETIYIEDLKQIVEFMEIL